MCDLMQYRIFIGLFLCALRGNVRTFCSEKFFWCFIYLNYIFNVTILPNIVSLCGDVGSNPGPQIDQNVVVGHMNSRSLLAQGLDYSISKFDEIKSFILLHNFAAFAVSETWLDESIENDALTFSGYSQLIRRDRNRRGGGVCVFIKDEYPAKHMRQLEPIDTEIVCIEIRVKNAKHLIYFCYKPPANDTSVFLANLQNSVANVRGYNALLFMGDFNCKHSSFYHRDKNTRDGELLKSFFESLSCSQFVHEPTRFHGGNDSCLDLFFTNNPALIINTTVHPLINNCDHAPVSVTLKSKFSYIHSFKRNVWDFKRGDFNMLRNILSHHCWGSIWAKDDVNECVNEFVYHLREILEFCIPHYTATIRPRDKPFMTGELRNLMRNRDRLHKIFKQFPNDQNRLNYNKARNEVVRCLRNSKLQFETTNLMKLDTENTNIKPKSFWHSLRSFFQKNCTPINAPLIINDAIISDPEEKAEEFNDYFVRQTCIDESEVSLPEHSLCISHLSLDVPYIEEFEVYKILNNLDISKATGPDEIGNFILREIASPIAKPLCRIFNICLQKGVFPDIWKIAQVTPLHKKGSINMCENYRPISLLCCISKVFEKLVHDYVYRYLKSHNLLTSFQSGFCPGDSTVRQLVSLCHKIYSSLDNGDEVLSVFLDFRKAFDTVWHQGLIWKLEEMGITGHLLSWFQSYLSNRTQYVALQGIQSLLKPIKAGVPQGSVLGPLLFLIFINDICVGIRSNIQLYADDTSLFMTVKKGNMISAVNDINDDLNLIQSWCTQWLLKLNTEKSTVLLISRKLNPTPLLPVKIGRSVLTQTVNHRHLGLTLGSRFHWSEHIEGILNKSTKRLNMLQSLKNKLPRFSLETLYLSYIRPLLEYADIIWCNSSTNLLNSIENIQIRAAQIVTGAKRRTSHESLYKEIGWESLSQRRNTRKLIFIHELQVKKSPKHLYDLLPTSTIPNRSLRNPHQIPQFRFKTDFFRKSALPSSIDLHNKLHNRLKSLANIRSFKRELCKINAISKNKLYYFGNRRLQIITAQIRMNFSDLNFDLFRKHCIDNAMCSCNQAIETGYHYFFECKLFEQERHILFSVLYDVLEHNDLEFTLEVLLSGSSHLPFALNKSIIYAAQNFIIASRRFSL